MIRAGVGRARVKRLGVGAGALCARGGRRGWAQRCRGACYRAWCAFRAAQACSLACYVLHDIYGFVPSQNSGHGTSFSSLHLRVISNVTCAVLIHVLIIQYRTVRIRVVLPKGIAFRAEMGKVLAFWPAADEEKIRLRNRRNRPFLTNFQLHNHVRLLL